jgi:phosphate/sulfate permease
LSDDAWSDGLYTRVGAVVFVGAAAFGPKKVAWGMFGRIVLTWVLTLPIAGLAAVGLFVHSVRGTHADSSRPIA